MATSAIVVRSGNMDQAVRDADIILLQRAAVGSDASPSATATQLGASTASFLGLGMLNRQVSAAGVSPGATAADNVLAVYSLPANALNADGRTLRITAWGSLAANGNTKTVKIIFKPDTAVVGSTVGSNGITVASSGAVATSGGGFKISGTVVKVGAANSNTQITAMNDSQTGTAMATMLAPTTNVAAVENAAILIAVTGNSATTASDIVLNILEIVASN